jgi:hypothetical protein
MHSNDAIEAVAPLGGRIREAAFPDAAAVLASTRRDSPLSSASCSTPLKQDQHTAIGEATKVLLDGITNLLATIDYGLLLWLGQTAVEGTDRRPNVALRDSAVQLRVANPLVEIESNKMDTRTLRPGVTLLPARCHAPNSHAINRHLAFGGASA